MSKKNCGHYSGIGGQAVLEGVMMKNKDEYAVAVRKPDGNIEVKKEKYAGALAGSKLTKLPFVRGVFNFIDSLVLGMQTLTYSASFYEDDEAEETKTDKLLNKVTKGNAEKVFMGFTVAFSIVLAVADFYRTSLWNQPAVSFLCQECFSSRHSGRRGASCHFPGICGHYRFHEGYQKGLPVPWSGAQMH